MMNTIANALAVSYTESCFYWTVTLGQYVKDNFKSLRFYFFKIHLGGAFL